jgi:hypothetical protein
MALDMLSTPAMSAKPERVFLGSKVTILDRRRRLGIQVIEVLKCLNSWIGIAGWIEETVLVDVPFFAKTS